MYFRFQDYFKQVLCCITPATCGHRHCRECRRKYSFIFFEHTQNSSIRRDSHCSYYKRDSHWSSFRRDSHCISLRRDSHCISFRRDSHCNSFRRDSHCSSFKTDCQHRSFRRESHHSLFRRDSQHSSVRRASDRNESERDVKKSSGNNRQFLEVPGCSREITVRETTLTLKHPVI